MAHTSSFPTPAAEHTGPPTSSLLPQTHCILLSLLQSRFASFSSESRFSSQDTAQLSLASRTLFLDRTRLVKSHKSTVAHKSRTGDVFNLSCPSLLLLSTLFLCFDRFSQALSQYVLFFQLFCHPLQLLLRQRQTCRYVKLVLFHLLCLPFSQF